MANGINALTLVKQDLPSYGGAGISPEPGRLQRSSPAAETMHVRLGRWPRPAVAEASASSIAFEVLLRQHSAERFTRSTEHRDQLCIRVLLWMRLSFPELSRREALPEDLVYGDLREPESYRDGVLVLYLTERLDDLISASFLYATAPLG